MKPIFATGAAVITLLVSIESHIISDINADRAAAGLQPVHALPSLTAAAESRAIAQLDGPTLSHDGWEHSFDSLPCKLEGENLARTLMPTDPDIIEEALMDSPSHRKNILQPEFNAVAVGAVDRDGERTYAQLFCEEPTTIP